MPIEYRFDVAEMTKSDFHQLDYQVMSHAFGIQNEFGRLCSENIFQKEMAFRCLADGLSVLTEGELVVSIESFRKMYFIDALMNGGGLYEFKAVAALGGTHEAQLLNYLFLCGLQEGKLINFASPSVEHRFVSTNIRSEDRFVFSISDCEWDTKVPGGDRIREIVQMLLEDWGAFLEVNLYSDAIFHFLGGKDCLHSMVEFYDGERLIGHQPMFVLSNEVGVHISAVTKRCSSYRKHLERKLLHTNLKCMQWVNFCRNDIQMVTLKK